MSQVFDALRKAEQVRKSQDSEQNGMQSEAVRASAPRPAGEVAYLGPGISIRGEITGDEPLEIAGKVNGQISLVGHTLTVGQTAQVVASIVAGEIVVYGTVDGDLRVGDRLIIKRDSTVSGELTTARIVIEEGATVKAKIQSTPPRQ